MALNPGNTASNEASVASLEPNKDNVKRGILKMRDGEDEVKRPDGRRKRDIESLKRSLATCAGKSSERLMTEKDRAMKVGKETLR